MMLPATFVLARRFGRRVLVNPDAIAYVEERDKSAKHPSCLIVFKSLHREITNFNPSALEVRGTLEEASEAIMAGGRS
jgi:hypothetical protein